MAEQYCLLRMVEAQHEGGRFEVPESWDVTIEELRAEGPLGVEEHEARQAVAGRPRLS